MELSILDTNLTATETTLRAIDVGTLSDLDARLINSLDKIVRYSANAKNGDYTPDNQAGGIGFWILHPSNILILEEDGYDHVGNNQTKVSNHLILYPRYVEILCSDYNHVNSIGQEALALKLWANCTDEERMYAVDTFIKKPSTTRASDYTTKIAFLESYLTISTAEAKSLWANKWAVHQHKDIDSCLHRWHSDAMHLIIPKYLNLDNVDSFLDASYEASAKFIERGLKTDILFYINTTLITESWTPKDGQTLTGMRDEILTVIDTGIH